MTHQLDVASGRGVVARWCALAERRLEYLTELFETGRWRRYHSELEFLENINEARAAVETWRDLATHEASRDHLAANMSWLRRPKKARPRRVDALLGQVQWLQPEPAQLSDPAHSALDPDVPVSSPVLEAAFEPVFNPGFEPALEPAPKTKLHVSTTQERYPLLRNAL